jgi:hypothetical protein
MMKAFLRPRNWKLIFVAAVASVGIVRTSAAQAPEEPSVGTRIRIGLPDSLRSSPLARRGQWVAGTLVRATQDSLVLHVGGANPLSVARRDITAVDVSEGSPRARSAVEHAIFGGVLFAAATYLVDHSEGDLRGRNVAIAASSGVAIGAFLGVLSPFEHWRKLRR